MAQEPVLSAATLTSLRDDVARAVFGAGSYSDLHSTQQEQLTNLGNDAFFEVTSIGKWYTEVSPGTTDLPTEWNELFKAVWTKKALLSFRSTNAAGEFGRVHVQPLMERIAEHYTASWNSAAVLQDDTFTPQSLRRSVIARCIRQKTPVFPNLKELDGVLRDEFVKLWNERPWEFRKRPMELTITTDGEVLSAEAFKFDGMASKSFIIRTTDGGTHEVKWIDSHLAAKKLAMHHGTTGRPKFFYDVDKGEEKSVLFIPTPDGDYTAFATILIGAPDFAGVTSTSGIANLPVEFRMNLRDMCFAKCLAIWGRENNDAARAMAIAQGERDRLAAAWDDKGSSRSSARSQQQQRWVNDLMSGQHSRVIGQG